MLEKIISKKYNLLKPFLDEKSKRLFAAAEALSIGKGSISIVSRATGISENTIKKVAMNLKMGRLRLMIKYVFLVEVVKKVLIKILRFCLILKHLLNQQVVGIQNLLYSGPVKVFEI